MKNGFLSGLSIGLAIAVGVYVLHIKAGRDAEARETRITADLQRQVDKLRVDAQRLEREVANSQKVAVASRKEVEDRIAARPVATRRPDMPKMELAPPSPTDIVRERVQKRQQPLYDRLSLGPEASQKFTNLIMERKQAEGDLVNAAFHAGKDANGVEVKREAALAQVKLEEKIGSEFGELVLSEYRRHEWLMSAADLMKAANAALPADNRFTDVQTAQLISLVSQVQGIKPGAVPGNTPTDPVPYRIRLDNEMLGLISAVASSQQMTPFNAIQAAQEGRPRP